MHSSFFNVFHHAADKHFSACVANCIHIDLGCVIEEAIDEHWALCRQATLSAKSSCSSKFVHRSLQMRFVVHDLHCPPTKYIARSHEHWVTNARGNGFCFVKRKCSSARRLRNLQFLTQCAPLLAVFSKVNGLGRSSCYQFCRYVVRQLQWCLSAKAHNHSRRCG